MSLEFILKKVTPLILQDWYSWKDGTGRRHTHGFISEYTYITKVLYFALLVSHSFSPIMDYRNHQFKWEGAGQCQIHLNLRMHLMSLRNKIAEDVTCYNSFLVIEEKRKNLVKNLLSDVQTLVFTTSQKPFSIYLIEFQVLIFLHIFLIIKK